MAALRNLRMMNGGFTNRLDRVGDYLSAVVDHCLAPEERLRQLRATERRLGPDFVSDRMRAHAQHGPSEEVLDSLWKATVDDLGRALSEGAALIEELRRETGRFVFSEAYDSMFTLLQSREAVIMALLTLSRPNSPEDVADLRGLQQEYENMVGAIDLCLARIRDFVNAEEAGATGI